MVTEFTYKHFCPKCEKSFKEEGRKEEAKCPECGCMTGARGFLIDEKDRYEDSMGRKVNHLSAYVLHDIYDYVIDRVKKPMRKAIVMLANRLPFQVTRRNATLPNTHRILDAEEWLFSNLKHNKTSELYMIGKERADMFHAIFKIVAYEIEHDPWIRFLVSQVFKYLVKSGWEYDERWDIHHKYWNNPEGGHANSATNN